MLLGLGLLLSQAALGEDGIVEMTSFLGYRAGGEFKSAADNSDRKLDDSASFGAILNLLQTPGAYYELTYSKQNTQLQGATPLDLSVEYWHIGGLVEYAEPENRVIPYFVFTAGATRFSPRHADLNAQTEFSFALGGGIKVPLVAHWALRMEARGYATLLNADSSIFCVSSSATTSCDIRVKGNALIQVQGLLGVTLGF